MPEGDLFSHRTASAAGRDGASGRHAGDGFRIAEKRELWWDPRPGKGEAAWGSLALQFGFRYTNPRHFKKRFLGYLRSVIDYYPEAKLESSAAGLVLKPSPTHVARREGARR